MLRQELMKSDRVDKMLSKEIEKASLYGEVNSERISQVLYVYEVMKLLTGGRKGKKVTYKLNKPFKGMGSVGVTCKKIDFTDSDAFKEIVKLSNNFEVYPKVNGSLQMNFTFYGILNKQAVRR